jgi:hypothetical protein
MAESVERIRVALMAMADSLKPVVAHISTMLDELEKAGVSPDGRALPGGETGDGALPGGETLPDGTPISRVVWIKHGRDEYEYKTADGELRRRAYPLSN